MKNPKTLTIKQENFCRAYLRLGNKSAAYREAYNVYDKPIVAPSATRISSNPLVMARIKELQQEAQVRNNITLDELLQNLAAMVRFDIADLYDENGSLIALKDMPLETRQMIQQLDVSEVYGRNSEGVRDVVGAVKKIKTYSRTDAIEKLMKHLGGYEKDNQQSKPIQNIVFLNLGDGEPE
ncbi:terminase small subunit [Flavobacterium sp. DGU11]|uniref:Terminase small subunit n=1 Tax=Flavobacterium arundinis TaxID=3139143 RepID=A0ABU9HTQ6_9FLAO